MEVTTIYLVTAASLIAGLILWNVYRLVGSSARRSAQSWLRKLFVYTLVYRRRKGTDSINFISLCYIVIYIGANVTLCVVGISDRSTLAKRCGTLFLANLIPLFLGGRLSFLTDTLTRVRPWNQSLAHRWIGRVCILEGAVHGVLGLVVNPATVVQILLLSTAGVILGLSLVHARRHLYELFLKTHLLLALLLVGLLWYHIPIKDVRAVACLLSASGLWLLQQIMWLCYFCYWNTGSRRPMITKVPYKFEDPGTQVMRLTVSTKMSHRIQPGHYVYLTFSDMPGYPMSLLQAHPYVVAWKEGSECTFLIQRDTGLSNDLFNVPQLGPRVLVDGPYGNAQNFDGYEKVLFVANGIGIAAHLLSIRTLLEAEMTKTTCVRRISLVWLVETIDQENWAQEYFDSLDKLNNKRHTFTRTLFVPSRPGTIVHHVIMSKAKSDAVLNMSHQVWGEHEEEPGNMLVIACGTPHFEKVLGSAVLNSPWSSRAHLGGTNDLESGPLGSVDLQHSSFRPEETPISRTTWARYKVGEYIPGSGTRSTSSTDMKGSDHGSDSKARKRSIDWEMNKL